MERIENSRLVLCKQLRENALGCLEDAVGYFAEQQKENRGHLHARNSLIKTFEFTLGMFRKYLRYHFETVALVDSNVSVRVLRECVNIQIITLDEERKIEDMISDRNDTSHECDRSIAEDLAARIPTHFEIMKKIFERLNSEQEDSGI